EDDSEAILAALVKQAKAGDVQAARVLLDRVCPIMKAQAQPVEVAGLSEGRLAERATAALDAAARGDIAPDVAGVCQHSCHIKWLSSLTIHRPGRIQCH